MNHKSYLVFCIRIRHIKIGNSQPFKAICQIKSRLVQINELKCIASPPSPSEINQFIIGSIYS
ncbi:hypothetical protein DL735_25740 [Escherichia coli]|nr:hypothetical protein [Escherichia coli]